MVPMIVRSKETEENVMNFRKIITIFALVFLAGCNYQNTPENNNQLIEMGAELMRQSKGY